MSDVLFTVSLNKTAKTVTILDNGSDYSDIGGSGAITSITVLLKTENKDSYVYRFFSEESLDITDFLGGGLTLSPDIFVDKIADNFYVVEVIVNEDSDDTIMLSQRQVFTSTDDITKYIEINALSVNYPPTKLMQTLPFSMALQLVDLLLILSDSAVYTYERENKWRKIYNAITTMVDEYKY